LICPLRSKCPPYIFIFYSLHHRYINAKLFIFTYLFIYLFSDRTWMYVVESLRSIEFDWCGNHLYARMPYNAIGIIDISNSCSFPPKSISSIPIPFPFPPNHKLADSARVNISIYNQWYYLLSIYRTKWWLLHNDLQTNEILPSRAGKYLSIYILTYLTRRMHAQPPFFF